MKIGFQVCRLSQAAYIVNQILCFSAQTVQSKSGKKGEILNFGGLKIRAHLPNVK